MATIQNGGGQNKLGAPNKASYSTFNQLTKHVYTTMRFGQQQVYGVLNVITGDKVRWRSAHELKTYTLKAPLMTPLYMEKDLFLVPRQAILPLNWDKIYQQPRIGEDINAQVIGTSVAAESWQDFLDQIETERIEAEEMYADAEDMETTLESINLAMQSIIMHEYIYSYGSLLNCLGCKMAALWQMDSTKEAEAKTQNVFGKNFDTVFELTFAKIRYGLNITDQDSGETFNVDFGLDNTIKNKISVHEFLDKLRDEPTKYKVTGVYEDANTIAANWDDTSGAISGFFSGINAMGNARREYAEPVDLARLWAYQLTMAEFYTNDKVDYVYTAELFRQYVRYISKWYQNEDSFTWNGIEYEYDSLSAKVFTFATFDGGEGINKEYCATLFSYKRSLKYLDYFTGSKTRPLAIGDTTINPDAGGNVSVVDITYGIQKQRFLNAVNRLGAKAEEYAAGLFGVKMARDYHNPIWLGSTRDAIKASETENTGEAQIQSENAITSHLFSYGGNKQFEINVDRDGILIGIVFFDLERAYSRGTHRSFMHVDRYDMYNPYLQYTGDQELKGAEYDTAYAGNGEDTIFGYVPAYEEFKQDFNEAQAGFVTALPGYTFIDAMEEQGGMFRPGAKSIGPDFIRTKPTELDRYYNSLTGNSLANYFHFIIDFYNEIEAKRPMSYNPQIL